MHASSESIYGSARHHKMTYLYHEGNELHSTTSRRKNHFSFNFSIRRINAVLRLFFWIDDDPFAVTRTQMASQLFQIPGVGDEGDDSNWNRCENQITELTGLGKRSDESATSHVEGVVEHPLNAANDAAILDGNRFLIDLRDGAVEHPQAYSRRHEADY